MGRTRFGFAEAPSWDLACPSTPFWHLGVPSEHHNWTDDAQGCDVSVPYVCRTGNCKRMPHYGVDALNACRRRGVHGALCTTVTTTGLAPMAACPQHACSPCGAPLCGLSPLNTL